MGHAATEVCPAVRLRLDLRELLALVSVQVAASDALEGVEVEKVARAGADFAICPANTANEAFEFMRQRSPIPWLHIVEVVAEAAAGRGLSKLGILGTKFLMEGKGG